jgi:hypothetical protein
LLQQNGLIVNPDKCLFGCASVDFLGHLLSVTGIGSLPSRVQAVTEFPRPARVKQLQGFLGLFNFYPRFILVAAKLVLPLTRALRGRPKRSTLLPWALAMAAPFAVARGVLSSSAVLAHPVAGAELSLITDASTTHMGAVIQQRRRGQAWLSLGFFSAQLNKAELNYSTFDRELLAVVAAIRQFHYMLEGRSFVVFTDHKPLVGALHRRSDPMPHFGLSAAPPLLHHRICPEHPPYHLGVQHCRRHSLPSSECSAPPLSGTAATDSIATCSGPGAADQGSTKVNVHTGSSVPPAIARSSLPPSPVDLMALKAAQAACPDCQPACSSSALRVSEVMMQGTPLLVDTSSGVLRLLVSAAFRRPIFDAVYSLAHLGIRATRRLISSCFVWPCLASQVAAQCRDCQQCQRPKSPPTRRRHRST